MSTDRPLRRSRSNRMIAGVVGGLAEHFGLNATVLRIVYVLVVIAAMALAAGAPESWGGGGGSGGG